MLSNTSHLLYIILSPVISTTCATLNGFTIFIFLKRFRLTTLTTLVIVNICACDIFVCLFSNTFYMANLLHPKQNWTTGMIGCKLFKSLTMFANIAQIYLLCVLSADRIRRLLDYSKRQWTRNDGHKMVLASWAASMVLTIPRLFLFEEKGTTVPGSGADNSTFKVVMNCKPIGNNWYAGLTIVTFIVAYALPTCFILMTLIRAKLFMWRRRNTIHIACNRNALIKMNNTLSLTFALTSALFVAVWTPFFVLSMLDLRLHLTKQLDMKDINFTLRCTLLTIGSSKPIIYILCLEKFRNCFCMKHGTVERVETSSNKTAADSTGLPSPGTINSTQNVEVSGDCKPSVSNV